ncbi:MAG: peptidoglycan DD-metalloendopeptidase family protein, partial [Saprospiraceae bacterium]
KIYVLMKKEEKPKIRIKGKSINKKKDTTLPSETPPFMGKIKIRKKSAPKNIVDDKKETITHNDSSKKKWIFPVISIFGLAIISVVIFLVFFNKSEENIVINEEKGWSLVSFLKKEKKIVSKEIYIQNDISMDEYISNLSLSHSMIKSSQEIAKQKKTPKLNMGDKTTIFHSTDSDGKVLFMRLDLKQIPDFFYLFDFTKESAIVSKEKKELSFEEETINITIDSTLYHAIWDNVHFSIIPLLDNALKWDIDLHHLFPGDKFTAIVEKKYTEGKLTGISRLKAIRFTHKNKDFMAIWFKGKYFDGNGYEMKNYFLKSPIKYGGFVSSRFNLNRLHPVLKEVKPHFGTDFAAEEGTPIVSTADGTIERMEFSEGNGNFVKIKHDNIYQTQYLHMKGFAPGLSKGSRVLQGQVIGYVGMTGLATGPHVCYRFWKNKQQIDPIETKVSKKKKMAQNLREDFFSTQKKFLELMDNPNLTE